MEDGAARSLFYGAVGPLFVERRADLGALILALKNRASTVCRAGTTDLDRARDEASSAGVPYTLSYPIDRTKGRWAEERVFPIPAADGAGIEWIGTITECRERSAGTLAFRDDEAHLLATAAAIGVGVWTLDLEEDVWTWSAQSKAILGLSSDAPENRLTLLNRVHPDDRSAPGMDFAAGSAAATMPDISFRILRADTGAERWIAARTRTICDKRGQASRIVATLQDITDRRLSELEQEANAARLNSALQIGRMIVWDLDIATGIVTRSANAEEVLGVRREPIADFFDRIHPDDRAMVDWETDENPTPPAGDIAFRYSHPSGAKLWLESSAIKISALNTHGHIVGITTDITQRRLAEEKLIHAANHDPLTGLLNRKAWAALLDDTIVSAADRGQTFHLLLLDIDHFKSINDDLGHDAGDLVLRAIADRLAGSPLPIAAGARLGGDEFAAILRGAHPGGDLKGMTDAFIEAICKPVTIGERSVLIRCSVGLAAYPDHATTARDLSKNADLALYEAKKGGRRQAQVFSPDLRLALDARTALHAEFRAALRSGLVVPFYQPKHDLVTGGLVGFEALARWIHPTRGVLSPAVFGSVFEDAELTRAIGRAIRSAVLRDMKRWLRQGLRIGRVAVNCASHDFTKGDLARTILQELDRFGVPPESFEIEVTEGVMIEHQAGIVKQAMSALHDAGVKISLDDFGTGYASLIHLKRFPVDEIKIDCTFVKDMEQPSNAAIIKAILGMGQSLGLTTVAEGVETPAQADALLHMGCVQAQGFLFGRPMAAERVPRLVGGSRLVMRSGAAPHRLANG